jgi:hypothetical protein
VENSAQNLNIGHLCRFCQKTLNSVISRCFVEKKGVKMKSDAETLPETIKVNIRPLKSFACKELPEDCALRAVLLLEKEVLDSHEFLAKLEVWMSLARFSLK